VGAEVERKTARKLLIALGALVVIIGPVLSALALLGNWRPGMVALGGNIAVLGFLMIISGVMSRFTYTISQIYRHGFEDGRVYERRDSFENVVPLRGQHDDQGSPPGADLRSV
jgi:uncharacterized membrane protein